MQHLQHPPIRWPPQCPGAAISSLSRHLWPSAKKLTGPFSEIILEEIAFVLGGNLLLYLPVHVTGMAVSALVDTRANHSFVSAKFAAMTKLRIEHDMKILWTDLVVQSTLLCWIFAAGTGNVAWWRTAWRRPASTLGMACMSGWSCRWVLPTPRQWLCRRWIIYSPTCWTEASFCSSMMYWCTVTLEMSTSGCFIRCLISCMSIGFTVSSRSVASSVWAPCSLALI